MDLPPKGEYDGDDNIELLSSPVSAWVTRPLTIPAQRCRCRYWMQYSSVLHDPTRRADL